MLRLCFVVQTYQFIQLIFNLNITKFLSLILEAKIDQVVFKHRRLSTACFNKHERTNAFISENDTYLYDYCKLTSTVGHYFYFASKWE